MAGLGTIANVAAILFGTTIGLFIKGGLPERFHKTILSAIGLITFFIGASGVLSVMFTVKNGQISVRYTMLMVLSLVIGAVLGEWINIEKRLESAGEFCKKKIRIASTDETFVDGFVSASLLFCVGAMAIVGSLQDGLSHNCTTLFAKSVLDGVAAIVFGASLGAGVYFSVIPLFLYQGAITLMANAVKPYLSNVLIGQISMVGSVLIFAIGINLVFGKKIKVGNLLPAIFIPLVIVAIQSLFKTF